jgi:isoquinoline 1-oxidoreductase beta subunit
MPMKLSRRSFLHSAGLAGGILLLDVRVPLRAADGAATQIIAGWIRIDPDGHFCLLMNATEMGQGAQSGLAQILAEELDLDWSQVRVDFAPIDREHYGMWETYQTGGSGSIRGMFDRLRRAGATARAMLIQAAAQRWGAPAEECVTRSGYVRHAQSSRSASYVTLARDAARLSPPKNVPLKARGDWQLIGKSTPRLDVRSKVNGTATYGIDVRRPGMLYAAIAQSPVFKGTLETVDDAPAMRYQGVRRVLKLDDAVVVVADSFWIAQKALGELKPVWRQSPMASVDSAQISERLRALTREAGKVYAAEGQDEAKLRETCEAELTSARRACSAGRRQCRCRIQSANRLPRWRYASRRNGGSTVRVAEHLHQLRRLESWRAARCVAFGRRIAEPVLLRKLHRRAGAGVATGPARAASAAAARQPARTARAGRGSKARPLG